MMQNYPRSAHPHRVHALWKAIGLRSPHNHAHARYWPTPMPDLTANGELRCGGDEIEPRTWTLTMIRRATTLLAAALLANAVHGQELGAEVGRVLGPLGDELKLTDEQRAKIRESLDAARPGMDRRVERRGEPGSRARGIGIPRNGCEDQLGRQLRQADRGRERDAVGAAAAGAEHLERRRRRGFLQATAILSFAALPELTFAAAPTQTRLLWW